ncbi:hypothetical protein [Sedimentitalea nanhaiensis]|uniref:hypothetical protein n=1 Tax=Sedimentitalea nanhaiensis TaxID=999627 RepID=UPI001113FB55|nr:hypothetical protein [Sedimentitalea nanhaiensis]
MTALTGRAMQACQHNLSRPFRSSPFPLKQQTPRAALPLGVFLFSLGTHNVQQTAVRGDVVEYTVATVEKILEQILQLDELISAVGIDWSVTSFAAWAKIIVACFLVPLFTAEEFRSNTALQNVHDGIKAPFISFIERLAFLQARKAARHERHILCGVAKVKRFGPLGDLPSQAYGLGCQIIHVLFVVKHVHRRVSP